MRRNGKAGAWLLGGVAVAATTACFGLLLWALSLQQQLNDARENTAKSVEQAKMSGQEKRELAAPVGKGRGLAAAPAEPDGTEDTGAAESLELPAALQEATKQATSSEEPANPLQQALQNFSKVFEDVDTTFTEADAESMVDSEYADLFEQLALPEETEQRLRKILRDHMLATHSDFPELANMSEMDEDAFMKQMEQLMEQQEKAESDLRRQLRAVLTPAGMAIYDEYEATSRERDVRQEYDMDLAMNGSGMTGEVRSMLLDALVEEQLAQDEVEMNGESAEPDYIQSKMLVLQRSRERLSKTLTEQQMAEVDRYIERQQRWLNEVDEATDEVEPPEDADDHFRLVIEH